MKWDYGYDRARCFEGMVLVPWALVSPGIFRLPLHNSPLHDPLRIASFSPPPPLTTPLLPLNQQPIIFTANHHHHHHHFYSLPQYRHLLDECRQLHRRPCVCGSSSSSFKLSSTRCSSSEHNAHLTHGVPATAAADFAALRGADRLPLVAPLVPLLTLRLRRAAHARRDPAPLILHVGVLAARAPLAA